jgi:hypothetical protein
VHNDHVYVLQNISVIKLDVYEVSLKVLLLSADQSLKNTHCIIYIIATCCAIVELVCNVLTYALRNNCIVG